MRVRLDYGDEGLGVDLPDRRVTIVEPVRHAAAADPVGLLISAIGAPAAGPSLGELCRGDRTVAISMCDITRPQPRQETLRALLHHLQGVPDGRITILIATGTHRGNTEAELERMLGREALGRFRVINHDARDRSTLEYAGRTSKGTAVFLNRTWLAADVRITTGFVEPHFFAGFSGGPKLVAPGLAGLETVMTLHDAGRIAHPGATWGVTDGNPIHDEIREIAGMTGVHFAVDVTLNREKQITDAFAGDLFEEHARACEAVKRTAMRDVPEPFDVVLTTNSGYPLDQNLYQAVKGLSAAARVVRHGGTIVCAAECRDGLPDHGSYRALLSSAASPARLLEMIRAPGHATPDQWQVQIQAQVQLRARVLLKSGLSPADVHAAHLTPVDDVGLAVREALQQAGPESTLCVLPQGPLTIPYVASHAVQA